MTRSTKSDSERFWLFLKFPELKPGEKGLRSDKSAPASAARRAIPRRCPSINSRATRGWTGNRTIERPRSVIPASSIAPSRRKSATARAIESSTIGRGLAAIRDDELAAECAGVPTLRLKLFSATVSGALMGMAGTTFPYYLAYIEPSAAFSLSYAVNSIAMPLIGGMMSWVGPVIGAVLLGSVQQIVQVTISSAWNLLIVGVLLVAFVTLAPNGIMGWVDAWRRRKRS